MSNRSERIAVNAFVLILASGAICIPFLGWGAVLASLLGLWGAEVCLRTLYGRR